MLRGRAIAHEIGRHPGYRAANIETAVSAKSDAGFEQRTTSHSRDTLHASREKANPTKLVVKFDCVAAAHAISAQRYLGEQVVIANTQSGGRLGSALH